MAKTIRWLKNIAADEVSGVDLAANRGKFRFFKRAPGGGEEEPGMKDVHSGRLGKAAPKAPTAGDPDDFPEWDAEEGVTLYPWPQAVSDMGAAYSVDDGPRIAALLLAKYGEGPNGEIRLPAGADPVEAARAAIEEGKNLMKDNPLLLPEGKATKAMKSATIQALAEFFGKKKVASVKKEAAVATADTEMESVLAELKALNAHLSTLAAPATAKPKPKSNPDVDEEDEEEEELETDDVADEVDEEADVENPVAGELSKAVAGRLDEIVTAVNTIAERLQAVEDRVAKNAKGVSKAQHGGESAGSDKGGKATTYYSTMLGAEMPMDKVEPFLKRANSKTGDSAVKH